MPSTTIVDYVNSKKPGTSILDQSYVNMYNVHPLDSVWIVWQSIRGPLYQLIGSVLDKNCSCIAFDSMKYIGQDPFLADTTLLVLFPTTATAEHWLALELAVTNLVQEKVEDYGYHEKIKVLFHYLDLPLQTIARTKQMLDDAVGIEYDPVWL